MKKGLRPGVAAATVAATVDLNQRPDEEGIKTYCQAPLYPEDSI